MFRNVDEVGDTLLRGYRYDDIWGYSDDTLEMISDDLYFIEKFRSDPRVIIERDSGIQGMTMETLFKGSLPISLSSDIVITSDVDARIISEELFPDLASQGIYLSEQQLAALSGAYFADEIAFTYDSGTLILEASGKYIEGEMGSWNYVVWISRKGDTLSIKNYQIFLSPDAPSSLGTQLTGVQVASASRLGVETITGEAIRNDEFGHVGYYVWPRLGYSQTTPYEGGPNPLPAILESLKNNPENVPNVESISTLSDLMATPEGRDWWRRNGEFIHIVFDLSPNSVNMTALSDYLKEKGILHE